MQFGLNTLLDFLHTILNKMNFFKRKRKYYLMEKVEQLSINDDEKEKYLSKLELRNIKKEKSKIKKENNEDVARRIFRVFYRWSVTPEEAKDLVMNCLTICEKKTLDESKIDACLNQIIDSFDYHLRKKKTYEIDRIIINANKQLFFKTLKK